jgi:predicted transcriptional regulator
VDIVHRVQALRAEGLHVDAICKELGLCRKTVYKYLRISEQPRNGRPPLERHMSKVQTVKALREKGMSVKDIARQLGIARGTVYKYLQLDADPERGRPTSKPPQQTIDDSLPIQPDRVTLLLLAAAICWQAHEDIEEGHEDAGEAHEFLTDLQQYARDWRAAQAEDHVVRWIRSRVRRVRM